MYLSIQIRILCKVKIYAIPYPIHLKFEDKILPSLKAGISSSIKEISLFCFHNFLVFAIATIVHHQHFKIGS